MNENGPVVEARGVHKTYVDATRTLHILRGVEIAVRTGEALAIVGSSGAGKSTLLHLLAGLDRPTQGEVLLQGLAYSSLRDEQLSALRSRSIGIIYQFHHLLPEFTALENVTLAALVAGRPGGEALESARGMLGAVGLADRLDHRPGKLSGGEQQRVALARALVNGPSLALADEPTGNLDADTAKEAIDLLWKSTLEMGRALIIVTHEPSIARRADRILRLELGVLSDRTEALKSGRA